MFIRKLYLLSLLQIPLMIQLLKVRLNHALKISPIIQLAAVNSLERHRARSITMSRGLEQVTIIKNVEDMADSCPGHRYLTSNCDLPRNNSGTGSTRLLSLPKSASHPHLNRCYDTLSSCFTW